MNSESRVLKRRKYHSNIYKFYPSNGNSIFCVICRYRYRKDAPLSTLQKHIRVKHGFSIRNPPTPTALRKAIYDAKKELGLLENNGEFNMLGSDNTSLIDPIRTSRISINALLNPDPTSLEEAIADWVSNEDIPISLISSSGFQQIIQICNSSLVVPTESRLRMLTLKRTTPDHFQLPKSQFKSLPQYTISSSEESHLGDFFHHPNNYNYQASLDSPQNFENYQTL